MKRKNQGSVTVEASFILPITIGVIFFLIYLTFYLHDLSKIKGEINNIILQATLYGKHCSDISKKEIYYERLLSGDLLNPLEEKFKLEKTDVKSYLNKEIENGLFIIKVDDIDIVYRNQIIEVVITTKAPIFRPNKIMEQQELHNPGDVIRISKVIIDTGEKMKGIEELKNKLDQIVKQE